jgi:hypothetical protein
LITPPTVSVAATAIAGLAVICPVLTGCLFYSCYACLWSKPTREEESPGALCLLAGQKVQVGTAGWFQRLWLNVPPVAFITSAIAGLLLTWQDFVEGIANLRISLGFPPPSIVFANLRFEKLATYME